MKKLVKIGEGKASGIYRQVDKHRVDVELIGSYLKLGKFCEMELPIQYIGKRIRVYIEVVKEK